MVHAGRWAGSPLAGVNHGTERSQDGRARTRVCTHIDSAQMRTETHAHTRAQATGHQGPGQGPRAEGRGPRTNAQ